jgi:hypothetical protein
VSEKSLSVAAIIISTFALIVSIWQAKDSRDFNKLSFKPHLQINPKLTGNKESGLYLENAGTGTAFINSLTLTVSGKTYDLIEDNSSELFNSIDVRPGCYRESWPKKGAAIQSGKEFPLIKVSDSNIESCWFEAMKFLTEPNVIMNISYTSPYDEELVFSESISLTKRELGVYFELINKIKNITSQ